MSCPACGADGVRVTYRQGAGLVRQCTSCEAPLGAVTQDPAPEPPAPSKPTENRSVSAPALTPATVIRLARQRCRELRATIRTSERVAAKARKELASLERILDAEAPKPAVVRHIRTKATA